MSRSQTPTSEVGNERKRPLDLARIARTARAARPPKAGPGVRIVEEGDERLVLELTGVTAAFANGVRRALLQEVPALAIDEVEIHANSSTLDDEVIAQRLGLVPIVADPHAFRQREAGESGSTADDTAVFELRARFSGGNHWVLAGDLKWDGKSKSQAQPAHPQIPLVELAPGQELWCTCYARKGTATTHAKYGSVSAVGFRYVPKIIIKKDVDPEVAQQIASSCPAGLFEVKRGKLALAPLADPLLCSRCEECTKDREAYIELARDDKFEFTIEGTGARPVRELYAEALRIATQQPEITEHPEQPEITEQPEIGDSGEEFEIFE